MLIYNLKVDLFISITLADSAELPTDFSYTNFTVSCNRDALDRLIYSNFVTMAGSAFDSQSVHGETLRFRKNCNKCF